MKKIIVALVIILIALAVATNIKSEQAKNNEVIAPAEDFEVLLTYFIETITHNVTTTFEDYDKQGLGGEVDGFTLVKTYPGLVPSDFTNVSAYQGSYSEEEGRLMFTGHAASNSAVIRRPGMKTLLENYAKRLGIELRTKADVDELIKKLQG
jgi:hypothetical protein